VHLNHPKLVAARIAAVAHLANVRMPSPAAAMVKNSAYHIGGSAALGVNFN
jgi:hypothetical protein